MNGNHIAAAATDKLRDEMARKHDSAGVAGVGEVMTALLQAHPEYAPGILAEGKTLQGAYDALEKYARDHRGGARCVYVPQATAEKMMSDVGKKATMALTTPIVGALTAAVSGASDLTETVGKTEVVFDRMTDKVMKWSESSVQAMGLAQGTALEFASTYGDMATGMGLSIESSAEMAMNLTQLAADMASFKNIRTDVAAQKLNAVFTGETEGLKSLGIVMTQTNLQAFALSQGITQQVSSLSQAEQVALRYRYVMEATKNAQGDFERTGGSLANQTRKLTETLTQAGESFGTLLIPAVTNIVEKLQGFVQHIAEMDEGAKSMIITVGLAVAAVGPALLVGGKLISMIVSLRTALTALSLNPVVAALAAVAALGVAFVAFNSAMNGANTEATRATESYQRMKDTVAGIGDKDVEVTFTGKDSDVITTAEALVTELQSDKYKGKIAIDGDPALAEEALAKIEGDIAAAKEAVKIDGNPEAANTAIATLMEDIGLLESMVVVTEDPTARSELIQKIATLRQQLQLLVGSVKVTITAEGQEAITAAEALVTELQSEKYKGKIAIDGDTELAEAALEQIEKDIASAKEAVGIDGDPEAAQTAIETLKADIAKLDAMVVITDDPDEQAAIIGRIAQLKARLIGLTASVRFSFPDDDQAKLDHYRETLEKLPKDETFQGYGKFSLSEGTETAAEDFKAALSEAVGAVGDYKDAVEQLQSIADQKLQESIREVYLQTTEQAEALTALYKSGGMTREAYIEQLEQLNKDKEAEIKRLTEAAKAEKDLYGNLADGNAGNDIETQAEILEQRYDAGLIDRDMTGKGNKSLELIEQAPTEDRSDMQVEGLQALAGLQQQAQAQYEGLAAAVEAYGQAQADAAQQQADADALSGLAEDFGAMADAADTYSQILYDTNDAQLAFDTAMAAMGENADPVAIQALSDALHDADGNLVDYMGGLNAISEAERFQSETAEEAATAQQAAAEQKAQALADLQTSLAELQESGLSSEDAEQALIQIDETGVDISGAKAALIAGVPAAVEEAVSAANAAVESGENPMDALAAAVGASAGVVETATGTAVTTATTGAATTAKSESKQIGENLMEGAEDGVKAKAGKLASAAAQAVRDAIKAAKQAEESASPSKVAMREIGAPLMQGAEVGIVRETPNAIRAMKKSVGKLISGAAAVTKSASWSTGAAPAGPAPIDYSAMGAAMSGAMSGVRFGFAVNGMDLATASREDNAAQLAFRARQITRGYGGR